MASSIKLGYVKITNLGPGSYAGGLMVVDARGLPVDFRYTDPVTPSRVQQLLYGKSLDRHVKQDVIFKHLAEKIEQRPFWLLVDDEFLLDLPSNTPTVLVVETRLAPLKEVAQLQQVSEGEYLLQVHETGSPIRFKLASDDPVLVEKATQDFMEVAREGLDLPEPFGRIRSAVLELCAPSSARE